MKKSADFFMQRAFEIAAHVDPHKTAPNPRVGCVIVRNDVIISEGVHEIYGSPHAEVNAVQNIADLSDCDIYITLEPCHFFVGKKTGSCTDLLLAKNPRKIFIGALDPTFAGKNIERIRATGVDVEVLDCDKRNKQLNPFFPLGQRPYVCLKLAQTLNGKINLDSAAYSDGKAYISNQISRQKVHALRTEYAAILTTTETVLNDDPLFDIRLKKNPRIFSAPDVVVLGDREIPKNRRIFSVPDREVYLFPRQDLSKTLKSCADKNINSLLVEGGSWLSTELLKQNLVDEIQLFIAPKFSKTGLDGFQSEFEFSGYVLEEALQFGDDFFMRFIHA